MNRDRPRYVGVLGACCTADGVRSRPPDIPTAGDLRLLFYQDGTSWMSMTSGPLAAGEYEMTTEVTGWLTWETRMALDEARKTAMTRLQRDIRLLDALVIDTVAAFLFPHLVTRDGAERLFLESWQWRQHIRLRISVRKKYLWDFPVESIFTAGLALCTGLLDQSSRLRLIFHSAVPCFNDLVRFDDPILAAHTEDYLRINDYLARRLEASLPRFHVISPENPQADPCHQKGPHPFHYDSGYLYRLRRGVLSILH